MKTEIQRAAIARACGITEIWSHALPVKVIRCDVPDYPNDLNAMHEAEKTLTHQEQAVYTQKLMDAVSRSARANDGTIVKLIESWFWHATATQRAEAFLRTKGLWAA
jgi:hypothetical protein